MAIELKLINPAVLEMSGSQEEITAWRDKRMVFVPGAEHSYKFQQGHWDGFKRPGVKRGKKLYLYRGFLPTVLDDLGISPEEVEVDYQERTCGSLESLLSDYDFLFDYQAAAVNLIAQRRWGRISFATNAGKGLIMAYVAHAASLDGLRTIVLCDEISVMDALKGEFEIWIPDADIGFVKGGQKEPPKEQIILGMVKTLANRTKDGAWDDFWESFDVALLDEADRATADSWKSVLRLLQATEYRVGFSGSFPDENTMDGTVLNEIIGPELKFVGNDELISRGISAKPYVVLHPYQVSHPRWLPKDEWYSMSGPEKRNWIYDERVVYNPERHQLIASLLHPTLPNVVIVNRVVHGEQLLDYIPNSVYLHGSISDDERDEVLAKFEAGEVQNLIVTKILDRGSNRLGGAHCIVFASGEGSKTQMIQRIGRGLRRKDGKEYVVLKDIVDRGVKYLDKASEKRIQVYSEQGFTIRVVQ
jgi:superfamily II DNA or RNA helicase